MSRDSNIKFNPPGCRETSNRDKGGRMIFGELPLDRAEDAILAHTINIDALSLRKGTVLARSDIAALRQAGIDRVLAARLESGDIGEDVAALAIGRLLAGNGIEPGPATIGRVNLFASPDGVFCTDTAGIDAINMHDPRISVATIRNHARVEAGQMVATIKIIPFAVPGVLIEEIRAVVHGRPLLQVEKFRNMQVGLIQSRLPSIRETVLDRTLELMHKRVTRNGGAVVTQERVAHHDEALATAIAKVGSACDLIVIFSASAVADEADIVPRAIRRAGGEILRIGMPVDPGNLLVLGKMGRKYIIAAPGSARSARENSLDRVLDRLMAGMELDATHLARMGVGGLLL
ncbi:molybdopterin biosynthesis enzyme [Brucella abortus S19]|nr:molybdopterin biosynthesis enzyme [Brucella abortus S19]EFH33963.1 molybdopterin biosynthesis enzyme [Brucella abortus bv. 5 str. B3196]